MTLIEANFYVASMLSEIAARENCPLLSITGIHSIVRSGDGLVSIYVDVDPPGIDCGPGGESTIIVHVDERAVAGMDRDDILRALTSEGHTKH